MVAEHLPTSNWGGAVRSEPIKKNTRQNEKPRKKRLKKIKINKEEDKGERKLTKASRNEGCRYGRNKYCRYGRSMCKRYGRNGCYRYGRNRHSYACCNSWPLKSLCKQGDRHTDKTQKKKKRKKKKRKRRANLTEKKRRQIPIKSGSGEALSSSPE